MPNRRARCGRRRAAPPARRTCVSRPASSPRPLTASSSFPRHAIRTPRECPEGAGGGDRPPCGGSLRGRSPEQACGRGWLGAAPPKMAPDGTRPRRNARKMARKSSMQKSHTHPGRAVPRPVLRAAGDGAGRRATQLDRCCRRAVADAARGLHREDPASFHAGHGQTARRFPHPRLRLRHHASSDVLPHGSRTYRGLRSPGRVHPPLRGRRDRLPPGRHGLPAGSVALPGGDVRPDPGLLRLHPHFLAGERRGARPPSVR